MQPAKALSLVNEVLYLIFFTSLVCSFRAVSSISIGLILIAGLIKNKIELNTFFHSRMKNLFAGACLLLFLVHIFSLLYTHNKHEGWNDIRLKSGLLFIPLALCCTNYINTVTWRRLLFRYCIILAIVSLYCLGAAFLHYWKTADESGFFYHALVSPVKQHAIYFSIIIFIALVFLFESIRKNDLLFSKMIHISLVLFFTVFLFLLSSKLVIVYYALYLLYYFIGLAKNSLVNRKSIIGSLILIIIIAGLALTVRNPVSERFREIATGDLTIVEQDKFDPSNYFNGLQFRLLQWKFVANILTENHRWLTGVSPGDAQSFLDQKYISAKMYLGDPARGDRGYLGYNTHNQFLETILQTGIIGLIILLFLCFSLIKMAWQIKSRHLSFIIILLLAWLFTESALETQYGLLIFTFFPLFTGTRQSTAEPVLEKSNLL